MDIFYANEVLYINIDEMIDETIILKLKKRLYRILEDYGISQVEICVSHTPGYNPTEFTNIMNETAQKFQAKIKIK